MSHVIEHVPDPLDTLAEIHRVLRAGGTLAVRTPNAGSLGHRVFASSYVALDPPRHLHLFNGRTLAALARRVGFAESTVSSTLCITSDDFIVSQRIRRSGRGELGRWATPMEFLCGRAATFVEMLMRLWNPLVGDELLLVARK